MILKKLLRMLNRQLALSFNGEYLKIKKYEEKEIILLFIYLFYGFH